MKKIDTDFAVKCLIEALFEKGVINSATYFNIIKNEFKKTRLTITRKEWWLDVQ